MSLIVITKGQPFRFGALDISKSNNNSSAIDFVSESGCSQTKLCSSISTVRIEDSFISPAMAMLMCIDAIAPNAHDFLSQNTIWPSLASNSKNIFIINRNYLLEKIKKIIPTTLGEEKQKIEQRKLLRDIEAAWNSSVISPKSYPFIFRNLGWISKQSLLYPEPYQHFPIGFIAHNSTGIPKYTTQDYPSDILRYDPSSSDLRIGECLKINGTIFLYVDKLKNSIPYKWPQILSDNISPYLAKLLKSENVSIIDQCKHTSSYELALKRKLYTRCSTIRSFYPSFGSQANELIHNLKLDFHSTFDKENYKNKSVTSLKFELTDFSCFTNMLYDIYPVPGSSQIVSSKAIACALNLFQKRDDYIKELLELAGGFKLPMQLQDAEGIASILFGSVFSMLKGICTQTTRVLLLKNSDIPVNLTDFRPSENSVQFTRLISIDSIGNLFDAGSLGISETFSLLRSLHNVKLENPYRLINRIGNEKLETLRNIQPFCITVAIFDENL